MRKIILEVAVSLDGLIEGTHGEYDWCFTDQDYGLSDLLNQIDAIFMGRKSYELVQSIEGQNPWDGIKTYVFSRSLTNVSAGTEIVRGEDFRKEVLSLKEQPGKDIWLVGGAELITAFMNEGLVDEVRLAVHPIILGSGKPLFQNINERKPLTLTYQKAYSTGLLVLHYTMA
jgi:dihydrofolate reductase